MPENQQRKLAIGLFSFSSCEGCAMEVLNLLNTSLPQIKEFVEFRYCRVLKEANSLNGIDVAFVEGSVSTEKELLRLREVRKKSKRLVAMGGCAINGWPSNQRNLFGREKLEEFSELIGRFHQLPKILTVPEAVKADLQIQGCPIRRQDFEDALLSYAKEFGVKAK